MRVMNCIVNFIFDRYIDCKNMHGISYMKFRKLLHIVN